MTGDLYTVFSAISETGGFSLKGVNSEKDARSLMLHQISYG